jgi:hypothetical protein
VEEDLNIENDLNHGVYADPNLVYSFIRRNKIRKVKNTVDIIKKYKKYF